MNQRTKGRFIIPLLALAVITGSASITIVGEVSADSLTIIDYDNEGIVADTTQYFVLWNHGTKIFDL